MYKGGGTGPKPSKQSRNKTEKKIKKATVISSWAAHFYL